MVDSFVAGLALEVLALEQTLDALFDELRRHESEVIRAILCWVVAHVFCMNCDAHTCGDGMKRFESWLTTSATKELWSSSFRDFMIRTIYTHT